MPMLQSFRIGIVFATLWVSCFCLLVACAGGESAASRKKARVVDLESVIRWVGSVDLEENATVINVSPRVSLDPMGGFIVSDLKEAQVRIYGRDGRLRGAFGVKGAGPGEFSTPVVGAVRVGSDAILAAEFSGKLTLLDSTGARVLGTSQVPLMPLYGVVALDSPERVLLVGRGSAAAGGPLLHVWNRRSGTVERSFFVPPPPTPDLAAAAVFAGHAGAAYRSDRIAAVFAMDPVLHLFDTAGAAIGDVPIPFTGFRKLEVSPPAAFSRVAMQQWAESFSRVSDVVWLADDTLLVQYYDMDGVTPRWSLLGMTSDGEGLFEIRNTPRLLAVDPAGGELVFVRPGSETPNRWQLARIQLAPR